MVLKRILSLKMPRTDEANRPAQFYTQTEDGLYFWWTKWLVTDEEVTDDETTENPETPDVEEPEEETPEGGTDEEITYMTFDLSENGDGSVLAVADGAGWGTTNTITISGDGPIRDFTEDDPSPFTDIGNTYELVIEDGVSRIGARAFYHASISELIVPESVKSFGQLSFYQCRNLERVTMGDSVVLIDAGAFQACTSLTEITLSSGLYTIQDGAFIGTPLTTITIPALCSYVGASAFQLCTSMVSCYIDRASGSAFTAGTNAFDFQAEGATIYVHGDDITASLTDAYDKYVTAVTLY